MRNIKSDLVLMVGKNEEILWSGKPNKTCFLLEAVFNIMLPISIAWFSIDSMAFGSFMHPNSTDTLTNSISAVMIIFFLLHMMPVWMYLSGVVFAFLKYHNTNYIITDKAVYVSGGMFAKMYEMKSFTELSHVNLNRGVLDQMLGVGDVVLICNHDGYNSRHSSYHGITLCDLIDYQKVYNMVKDLNINTYTDTMYPNDLRPSTNSGYSTKYTAKRDWDNK